MSLLQAKIKIMEQAISAFKGLVNFVHSKPRTSIGTLLAVFVTIWVLLLSYRSYVSINQLKINQFAESPTPDVMQKLLKESSKANIKYTSLLKRLTNKGADRAFLMKFHNGSRDINGMHFMYVSTTNEVTRPGIENVMTQVQDIPTAIFDSQWIEKFLNNECAEITTDKLNKSNAMNNLLTKLGIDQMHICPIYDVEKGYLLGLSGVSWVGHKPDRAMDDLVDNELIDVNLGLSTLMTPVN